MNDNLQHRAGSGLVRGALLMLCSVLCTATVGASRPQVANDPVRPVHHGIPDVTRQAQPASAELLRDVTVRGIGNSTILASSVLPPTKTSRTIWVQVTAYCGCTRCCGPSAQGLTASGRSISYNEGRFVAADTRLLKFGTRLIVPGYADDKPVEVIDRGGAIKGYHIDIFFPTHEQAREWGRKWMRITVLD